MVFITAVIYTQFVICITQERRIHVADWLIIPTISCLVMGISVVIKIIQMLISKKTKGLQFFFLLAVICFGGFFFLQALT